jgi:hypothetical protein
LNSEKMVLLSVSGVKLVNSMSISKDPQASWTQRLEVIQIVWHSCRLRCHFTNSTSSTGRMIQSICLFASLFWTGANCQKCW